MSSDASKEWLDLAKSDIKRVQNVFTTLGVFIAVLCYTLSLQTFQLREYQPERERASAVLGHSWNKLEVVYSQAPFRRYYEEQVKPWYLLCLAARERHRAIRAKFPPADPRGIDEAIASIDSASGYLSELNSDLQTLLAHQHSTSFGDLDGEKLNALISVLDFKPKAGEKAFSLGLEEAQKSAFAFLKIDEATEGELALPPFNLPPELSKALKGDLKLPNHIVEIFRKGVELPDAFRTFELEMEVEDENKFGQGKPGKLTAQEKQELLADLAAKKFSTLKNLQTREAELTQKIVALEGTSITGGAEISLPFLGIAVPLNLFGVIGGFLNVALIAYLLWLLGRLGDSLANARRLSERHDGELYRAVTTALPFARLRRLPALAIGMALLVAPSLLSAMLLTLHVRSSLIPVALVTTTGIASAFLAYAFTSKARSISESTPDPA
jgi:hypothetical protein